MRDDFRKLMYTWFYQSPGDAITAVQPSEQIRAAFLSIFESSGRPTDMAVFTRNDSADRLHCEVSVYFSPAASEIAQTFAAKPCERPLKPGLELVAGDQESWSGLFPQNEQE